MHISHTHLASQAVPVTENSKQPSPTHEALRHGKIHGPSRDRKIDLRHICASTDLSESVASTTIKARRPAETEKNKQLESTWACMITSNDKYAADKRKSRLAMPQQTSLMKPWHRTHIHVTLPSRWHSQFANPNVHGRTCSMPSPPRRAPLLEFRACQQL